VPMLLTKVMPLLLLACVGVLGVIRVADDKVGSPFDGFSYPRLLSTADGVAMVAAKASVLHTNPQESGIAVGNKSLTWSVRSGSFTPAPVGAGHFDAITDYDAGGNGVVAFVGVAGDQRAVGCHGAIAVNMTGYLPSRDLPPQPHIVPAFSPSPPVAGVFSMGASPNFTEVLVTGRTLLPPQQLLAGDVSAPSVDSEGSVACVACAQANASISGIYTRASGPPGSVSTLRCIADTVTPMAALHGGYFHDFFSVSLEGKQAAFTANAWCGGHYECGVFLAREDDLGHWKVTPIVEVCGALRRFVGVGDAVLKGETLAFVAQDNTGVEAMYKVDTAKKVPALHKVAYSGLAAPLENLGEFAEFPQPPSVYKGELVFRAYTSSGDTGIFHSSASGKLSKLVSTLDVLEKGQQVVYMGSAESAFGPQGAYTFYASSVNTSGKDGVDGVYLGYIMHSKESTSIQQG